MGVLSDSPPDADGDGVSDENDDYPNDSSRYKNFGSESLTFPVTKADERQVEIGFMTGRTRVEFSVEVVNGSPVTIWVYDAKKIQEYNDDDSQQPIPDWGVTEVFEVSDTVREADIRDGGVTGTFVFEIPPMYSGPSKVSFSYEKFM